MEYNGVTYQIGQANNALMYPGLGLGLIASTATRVNAEIISQASRALGGIVDVTKPGAAILPPQLQLQLLFFVPFLQILSYSVSYEKSQREAAKEQ